MESFSRREFSAIVIVGTFLSSIGGCLNGLVFTGNFHITVSHVTGNMTKIGFNIAQGLWSAAGPVAAFTFSFMIGSLVAGLVMRSPKFELSKSYGIAFLAEASVLVLAWGLMHLEHNMYGAACTAFACGLQNALCTVYSGGVVRTTHMTGITTDIGILLGQVLSRNPRAEVWKLKVFVPLWIGYLVGTIVGAWAHLTIAHHAILMPAAALSVAAISYLAWGPARHAQERMMVAVKKVLELP